MPRLADVEIKPDYTTQVLLSEIDKAVNDALGVVNPATQYAFRESIITDGTDYDEDADEADGAGRPIKIERDDTVNFEDLETADKRIMTLGRRVIGNTYGYIADISLADADEDGEPTQGTTRSLRYKMISREMTGIMGSDERLTGEQQLQTRAQLGQLVAEMTNAFSISIED